MHQVHPPINMVHPYEMQLHQVTIVVVVMEENILVVQILQHHLLLLPHPRLLLLLLDKVNPDLTLIKLIQTPKTKQPDVLLLILNIMSV